MPEILIIGGGLAGAAAATHLARAGREVMLLEREPGPHDKVCGEFLSFEAQDYLRELDIDAEALGGVPLDRVAVQIDQRRREIPLPFRALSLSRRVLDEAVLGGAIRAGADVRRGVRATTLARTGTGWSVGLPGGGGLTARHLFLATGKHDLRGWKRPPGRQSDLVGFKSYWRLPDRGNLSGAVELHTFPGGYAGLEMVEGGRANLCLVILKTVLAALGGGWRDVLAHLLATCPGLARQLVLGAPCPGRPLAIAAIPYGLVQRESDGSWRLGDQAAVIPSFTGEGMSIALHSARLAASFFARGHTAEDFQRRLAADLRGQVSRSTMASRVLVSSMGQTVLGLALTAPLMRWLLRETRIAPVARLTS
ncbi:NAD(P)/FAD-dependent oxidoreductase [Rubellimicrobium arenae]|uniref:NAD(P)/FAD-dependent oxidoreductase n=1 Tax=Rubellimicrobium arenae TaxID=2817372 RepID=UPI001B3179B7|nr:FAD-dependent oxidoreductase [Rubellimicrobium arenae]